MSKYLVENRKSYIYAFLSIILWSTVATAFKITLRYIDSFQLWFFSVISSTIILFFVLMFQEGIHKIREFKTKDYLYSIILGFLNPFLYYLLLFKAYSLLKAQEALVINYTWPLWIALLSIPLLRQKLTVRIFLGLISGICGVVIVGSEGKFTTLKFKNPYGVLMALGSALVWALYWVLNTKDRKNPVARLFLNFMSGSVFITVFVFGMGLIEFPSLRGFIGAIYVGMFEMGITFILWLHALKLSRSAARISNLVYLTPFLSLLLINFVLREKVGLITITGFFLVIGSILLIHLPQRLK